jgi:hypothetical protein
MKSYKEIKKKLKLLWFIANSNTPFRWTAFKLSLSVFLYELRGIPRCPYHGYCTQSFCTGYCKKCGEIPNLPPIEETCIFCGEEKAVSQRASPNGDKEIWSLCWECDQYIDWSLEHSWCCQAEAMGLNGKMVEPFDQWLFEKHQVYPKHEYLNVKLKKRV